MIPREGAKHSLRRWLLRGGALLVIVLAFVASLLYEEFYKGGNERDTEGRRADPLGMTVTPTPWSGGEVATGTRAAMASEVAVVTVAPDAPPVKQLPPATERVAISKSVTIIAPSATPVPSMTPTLTRQRTEVSTLTAIASQEVTPLSIVATEISTPAVTSLAVTPQGFIVELLPTPSPTPSPTMTLPPLTRPMTPPTTPTATPTVEVPPSLQLGVVSPVVAPGSNADEDDGELSPQLLGLSTDGYALEVYQFGDGPIHLVFIGGIHGGYEWNTVLLAYALIDALHEAPAVIPAVLTVYVLPVANPDGLARVMGESGRFNAEDVPGETESGRFNGNLVDLNRNWDCKWQPQGVWGSRPVDAGSAPMSEVETQLLARWLMEEPMDGVVFWHSAIPVVLPGGCDAPGEAAGAMATVYGEAAGYPVSATFDNYIVTGDAADWLSLQGVAAITVELSTHDDVEWEQNWRGVQALMEYMARGE